MKHSSHRRHGARWAVGGALFASAILVSVVPLLAPDADAGTARVFTGIGVRADGAGYLLSSARGEMYAFGGAGAVGNPVRFAGDIVDVALTADGSGAMAVSSAMQAFSTFAPHHDIAVAVSASDSLLGAWYGSTSDRFQLLCQALDRGVEQ